MKSILAPLKHALTSGYPRGAESTAASFISVSLERGLVLLAFESHLVITLLKFSLANKKADCFFLSDADQTSFFKTIGFVAYLQKSAQIFYPHA